MDVARILRSRNYKGYFIFVTVMEELVFDSFEVQAFDYFVKPVNHERFHKTMERLLSVMQNSSETNLFIQRGNEWSIIPFDDIADLTGEGITSIEDYLGIEKYPDDI